MSAQVLPKEVRLTAPPTMPQARSYLFKQQATQSSYTAGSSGNIQINIPRLQRSYLSKDSYLKFKLETSWINDGTTCANPVFDTCGAYGIIDTIEIYDYLGSTLLERTSGHAQLMALLMDCHVGGSEMKNHFGTTSGCKGFQVGFDPDQPRLATAVVTAGNSVDVTARLATRKSIVQAPVSGQQLGQLSVVTAGTIVGNSAAATSKFFEFSLPLFSFLGTLSKKYAPLHNGFTINITLNTVDKVFGMCTNQGAAQGTFPTFYNLSDVYWCSQVLELGPTAESMLISSTQGQPMVIPAKAYRNYVGSLSSATNNSQFRLDLNLNVASLTNVLWIMRPSANFTGAKAKFRKSFSYRIRNWLQSWYFQYGSTILPQSSGILCGPPSGGAALDPGFAHSEAYNELMKARHNYSTSNTHSMITADTFWIDTPVNHSAYNRDINWVEVGTDATGDAATALCSNAFLPPGKFAGGIDLELVPGRSQDLICGMNTNGMNTSIFLNFDSSKYSAGVATTFSEPCQLDAWCEYDAFINISPGIATTVSF